MESRGGTPPIDRDGPAAARSVAGTGGRPPDRNEGEGEPDAVIVGIGIDQVEVARLRALLERWPERARERLFTEVERRECRDRARPAECLAARFAAKEALFKALGTGWARGLSWTEAEVATSPEGRPLLRLSGTARRLAREAGAETAHVSCTHEAGVAASVVILEG